MSNKTGTAGADTSSQQPASSTGNQVPKFSIERLRQNCLELFGVTSSTYDGAVHKLEGEFTVEQMKSHIKKWQGATVCPAKKEVK